MDINTWGLIIGMTAVTAAPRVLPLLLTTQRKPSATFRRWLELLPIAIFSSFLAPALLVAEGKVSTAAHPETMVVVAISALVVRKTRNLLTGLGVGLLVLLGLWLTGY